jgi:alpha-glucosidase
VSLSVFVTPGGHLVGVARFRGRPFLELDPLGLTLDGDVLGQGAVVGAVEAYAGEASFPWRGVHAQVRARFRGSRVALQHGPTGRAFRLDVRAFDDGVAFRWEVAAAEGRAQAPDAGTVFRVPRGSTVFHHDLEGHYEGRYTRQRAEEVPAGAWVAPPLTIELADDAGYAAITEAALADYAGMALQADGTGGFAERLGHATPPSYPFRLRYGEGEARRLAAPAAIPGPITSPWRVALVGADLDTLVRSDVVSALAPPPDPEIFPEGPSAAWIRPGRAVWKYLDGGENSLAGMKEFSRLAGELGFEYNVVEGFWRGWSDAEVRDLVEYSRDRGVGVFLWMHSRDLRDTAVRRRAFERVRGLGAVGLKVDFLDHEAKETVDLYRAILRDAAASRLLVNFHGANKPTGEARTWPNELTREAVYGLEHRKSPEWGGHDATLPFTRLLAGHADFTPVIFSERRLETSHAHQIATAAVFTSPLLVYGAHPRRLLDHPASDVIRGIPSVWDETRVLPGSGIGRTAAFARRTGTTWFVAIVNGAEARSVRVRLDFLERGRYQATLVRDRAEDAAAVATETTTVTRADALDVALRASGGFVGRFTPQARAGAGAR